MSRKQSFVTALTETWTAAEDPKKDRLGDIRIEGGKKYKCVQFDDGTANLGLLVNHVVYYLNYGTHTVTRDQSDTVGCGAGIVMCSVLNAGNNGTRFWIQIKGIATLAVNVTAGAVSNALTHVGAGDGTLDVSAAVTDPVVATLIDTTSGSQKIICDFPE